MPSVVAAASSTMHLATVGSMVASKWAVGAASPLLAGAVTHSAPAPRQLCICGDAATATIDLSKQCAASWYKVAWRSSYWPVIAATYSVVMLHGTARRLLLMARYHADGVHRAGCHFIPRTDSVHERTAAKCGHAVGPPIDCTCAGDSALTEQFFDSPKLRPNAVCSLLRAGPFQPWSTPS
jgi:hypothetical protein